MEANHPADLRLAHHGQLEPVVGCELLPCAANEAGRVLEGLGLRPGKPARQAMALRFDQCVQLLRIGQPDETEVRTIREVQPSHAVILANCRPMPGELLR